MNAHVVELMLLLLVALAAVAVLQLRVARARNLHRQTYRGVDVPRACFGSGDYRNHARDGGQLRWCTSCNPYTGVGMPS